MSPDTFMQFALVIRVLMLLAMIALGSAGGLLIIYLRSREAEARLGG